MSKNIAHKSCLYRDVPNIEWHIEKLMEGYYKDDHKVSLWCPQHLFPGKKLLNEVQENFIKKGWGHVSWKYYSKQWWERFLFPDEHATIVFILKKREVSSIKKVWIPKWVHAVRVRFATGIKSLLPALEKGSIKDHPN